MQLVVRQDLFAIALNEVKNGVASRPTHPILANVRLDADDKFTQENACRR